MANFQLFIDDDRYSVTTLRLLAWTNEQRAREAAETILRESPHHRGVELYRGARRVLGIGSMRPHGASAG
jgi:hypothetical protein